MLEIIIPSAFVVTTAIAVGSNEIAHKICRTRTSFSTAEWATLWQEKRDRLVAISSGVSNEPLDENIDELVNILLVAGRKLKGHGTSNLFRDVDRHYRNMSLTHIAWQSSFDGVWYASSSHVIKKYSHNNHSLRDDVVGLRKLAETSRTLDDSHADWFQRAEEFVQEYAAHLLLNYRSSPTSIEPILDEHFESVMKRQKALNRKREWLVLESDRLSGSEDSPASDGLQKAIAIAKTLPAAIEPQPKLVFELLTAEEQRVVGAFYSLERYLTKEERATVNSYLAKITVAVDAAQKAEGYKEDMREAVLSLTNENRSLAIDAITNLILNASTNTTSEKSHA